MNAAWRDPSSPVIGITIPDSVYFVKFAPRIRQTSPRGAPHLLSLLSFAAFLSATLLFLLQPMFGKMILPVFGGAPAVWITSLVFFQLMLLAGYLYVHVTLKWLGPRRQAVAHAALLLVPLAVLPIRVMTGWGLHLRSGRSRRCF